MVAEQHDQLQVVHKSCSLAKISMVAERTSQLYLRLASCSLAKISMVAEQLLLFSLMLELL